MVSSYFLNIVYNFQKLWKVQTKLIMNLVKDSSVKRSCRPCWPSNFRVWMNHHRAHWDEDDLIQTRVSTNQSTRYIICYHIISFEGTQRTKLSATMNLGTGKINWWNIISSCMNIIVYDLQMNRWDAQPFLVKSYMYWRNYI